jgi:uncharacterized protein YecE (DUF72 family)
MTGHDTPKRVYIGCAGWSLTRSATPVPEQQGTQLERYASNFRAVEINSSFHRSHRRATYERWAESVPESFRFSVKAPKTITHEKRLVDIDEPLHRFVEEAMGLGKKLGCLLVQLPPSLEYDADLVGKFFDSLRSVYQGPVVIEPRHKTWFVPEANRLLQRIDVTRVAADPAVVPAAAEPGGAPGKVYFRLHGSPQVYYSSYTGAYLDGLAFRLRAYARAGASVWCIFDNTIRGYATSNAQHLMRKIVLEEAAVAER